MFGRVLEKKERRVGEKEIEEEDWSLKRSKKVEGLQECERRLGREELEEMIGVMGEKVMRRINDEMGKMREEIRIKGGKMEGGEEGDEGKNTWPGNEDTRNGREVGEKDFSRARGKRGKGYGRGNGR
ncbi:hypothetical protein RF55_15273 [Lasius niger]|uniref:Uncharacterized protein n=1 Tax=Lasius niger TaxID=67767 RepID=A0A0J7K6T7_LASNI|nr:hypothetical protein RF55_15273 [Lasius niger]